MQRRSYLDPDTSKQLKLPPYSILTYESLVREGKTAELKKFENYILSLDGEKDFKGGEGMWQEVIRQHQSGVQFPGSLHQTFVMFDNATGEPVGATILRPDLPEEVKKHAASMLPARTDLYVGDLQVRGDLRESGRRIGIELIQHIDKHLQEWPDTKANKPSISAVACTWRSGVQKMCKRAGWDVPGTFYVPEWRKEEILLKKIYPTQSLQMTPGAARKDVPDVAQ